MNTPKDSTAERTPGSLHPDCSAVAEAVKGLCAAKLELIKCRDRLREQGMWMRFDEIWKQYTVELAALDARLDALTKPQNEKAQAQPPTATPERKGDEQ